MKKYIRDHVSKGLTLAWADADFPGNDLNVPFLLLGNIRVKTNSEHYICFICYMKLPLYSVKWYAGLGLLNRTV